MFQETRESKPLVVGAATSRMPSVSANGPARAFSAPPRLVATDTAVRPAQSLLMTASLRFPADLVRERAFDQITFARTGGAQHSMRLWRSGFDRAILALAREATHAPVDATCEALFWEERAGDFYVSVTFGPAANTLIH